MRRWIFVWPLVAFGALVLFLGKGLGLNPREVPSPLIGKPAPEFRLPRLDDPSLHIGRTDLVGQVWMLNVWASWCAACLEEHPVLMAFAKRQAVPIYGLNYKDSRAEAMRWLQRHGNPYVASISDSQGRVGIDFGVYGVPETFVIDKAGMVRYKHIGPITLDVLERKVEPLLRALNSEPRSNRADPG